MGVELREARYNHLYGHTPSRELEGVLRDRRGSILLVDTSVGVQEVPYMAFVRYWKHLEDRCAECRRSNRRRRMGK